MIGPGLQNRAQRRSDKKVVIEKLKEALRNNAFENVVQKNADVISCFVACGYSYNNNINIPCEIVKDCLNWFSNSTPASQELILGNLTTKLSNIEYKEPEEDLMF
jgi:serine/threonine-protein kinase